MEEPPLECSIGSNTFGNFVIPARFFNRPQLLALLHPLLRHHTIQGNHAKHLTDTVVGKGKVVEKIVLLAGVGQVSRQLP